MSIPCSYFFIYLTTWEISYDLLNKEIITEQESDTT